MTVEIIAKKFLLLTVCFVALSTSAQTKFTLKQILQTGDDAPVVPQLSFVDQFSLNDQGQVAFIGDGGLFLKSGANLMLLAGFGDPAPGGGRFIQASAPSINSNGEIVFVGSVTAPSTSGLFLFSQGKITLLVANGAVSTTGDVVFPTEPVITDAGAVAFVSNGIPDVALSGQGIFVVANGVITKIAVNGDAGPRGQTFAGFDQPAMNSSGQMVFHASLQSPNPNPLTPPDGLFFVSGSNITEIIGSGDTFPDGSMFFDTSGSPSINDAGQVAFAGFVGGFAFDEGVYLYSGGNLTVVVPSFSSGPGGITFFEHINAAINNAGQIAFESVVFDPDFGFGVFVLSDNVISEIMLTGQSSPDGDTFEGLFGLAINSSAQVVFASELLQHTDALYLWSGSQLVRVAGQSDSVNRQPKFEFPFAFGMSNDDQVLVSDSTFPGGIGIYTTDRTPLGKTTLDSHVSQSVGNDGVIFDFEENFPMNGKGQLVMNADFSTGVSSLLLKSGSTLTELVRVSFQGDGDSSPGGGTLFGIRWSSINNLGQVLFSGFASDSAGLYLKSNGQTTLAVDANTPLPDGTGTFGSMSLNAMNDKGDIAFLADLNGMYLLSNGQFTAMARNGDPAVGGGSFGFFFPDQRYGPVISNNGNVAFASDLSTGGRGIFLFSQGVLTRIAGPGDSSPDGSIFFTADAPTINSTGQIAFSGETGNGFGVFLYSAGNISKIVLPGDRLPGGLIFEFADLPQVNDLGHVAFAGDLSNGTTVVFIAKPRNNDDNDTTEFVTQSGPPDSSTPLTLAAARARHPKNFQRRTSRGNFH